MSPEITAKFEGYPPHIRTQLLALRDLIFDVASGLDKSVDESLKWGELSFVVKGGTAVRLGWASQSPNSISVYVHCQTRLVDTFREVLPDAFDYHGNRQLQFDINQPFPHEALRTCIGVAFTYQQRKSLPLLGM
ncbi:DUF1801 domain-containing protein [Enterovibrio calviensis]|uniref:DUF1801 domain-containing protein n=1 Tax=Enterovibrio calviensis TaxID=91359 RepID=UPI0004870CB9|nr:DUF1801 domain-containing protein [Enterovibrio calviensis]